MEGASEQPSKPMEIMPSLRFEGNMKNNNRPHFSSHLALTVAIHFRLIEPDQTRGSPGFFELSKVLPTSLEALSLCPIESTMRFANAYSHIFCSFSGFCGSPITKKCFQPWGSQYTSITDSFLSLK
ncbi:hypothetical protein TWF225_009390 [Orbilia oligospora]|nr:hypothetical protein TWF225_009390 [Orbilia oligospora]KAF3270035.1 hypothetical protein TWF217_008377 [Orbilia oligospora]KAF3270501.1 hypothetical protein TWF128_004266 [Orbilia oligospora]KAF3298013.1 hypothetical protein TWF132_004157 [Orbilia oligospora]